MRKVNNGLLIYLTYHLNLDSKGQKKQLKAKFLSLTKEIIEDFKQILLTEV